MRIIMHIDVNNAFLSWTAVDLLNKGFKTDIRNEYAVIGGDETKRHGIVLAKSIPAKKRGIVSAETLYNARKKCPNLKIYPPDYYLYQRMSNSLFELILKYTPDMEIVSVDECYIDYGKVKNLYGDEIEFAYKLKDEIKSKLGFTVNIGIANNKLCAKMASDFEKPNKVHTLFENEIESKMYPLQVGDLFGIGKSTALKLNELKIFTIEELSKSDPNYLKKHFKNRANDLINLAKGIDFSEVIPYVVDNKNISTTTTMQKNLTNKNEIYQVLNNLSENIGLTLRSQNKYAYVIGIIIKDKFFKSYSHQCKLKNATNKTKDIYDISKKLFDEAWDNEPVRLLGISLSNLVTNDYYQMDLFEDIKIVENMEVLDKTIDKLKKKYGSKIIKNASNLK